MCGIAGFISDKPHRDNNRILRDMLHSISHRGPDDDGIYIHKNTAMGMTRLSIVDVKGGKQPLTNEDCTIKVFLNGEIYNFLELRKKLEKRRHRFKTQSDTEVIAHLYEEKKDQLFDNLTGMFALAIWDENEQMLILARDRMGEKPLYYTESEGTFVFGSELKAIIRHPSVKKELDLNSLNRFLTFEYVPSPFSILKNIHKLEPGHYLIYKDQKLKKAIYWDIKFDSELALTEDNAVYILDKLIDQSIKGQLIADVPLGIFLSGGIDSSTVAYYATKNSNKKLKSFSIGFEDESFDESRYSLLVARYLDLDHYQYRYKEKELLDTIPLITQSVDEPFADASILPTYLLSRYTRKKVTVTLGGDGGDELFTGYPTFQAHRIAELYNLIPKRINTHLVLPIIQKLPVSYDNYSLDFLAKRFFTHAYSEMLTRNQLWLGAFAASEIRNGLLRPEILAQLNSEDPIDESIRINRMRRFPIWENLIYQYQKTYLTDDILFKVDRASMLNSLEVRSPFLDHHLVSFINYLPVNFKLRGLTTKYLLKKLMKNRLPKEILHRKKHGFSIPLSKWLNTTLKNMLLDILSEKKLKRDGIFNEKYISQLINEHLGMKKDNRKLLWTILMFENWKKNWIL